jgi:GT2 family glycosyltransferase
VEWLEKCKVLICQFTDNHGVSTGWNLGLTLLLAEAEHCLVIGNDVILPHWFYRELLSYEAPFVTGVAVDKMDAIKEPAKRMPLQPCPDFSAFLIRREAWEKIGRFDEGMKFYASDVDYHVRGAKLGIPMMKANVPYFHLGSSTLKNAPVEERAEIEHQADLDRAFFETKWGFKVGSVAHHQAVGFK